MVSPRLIENRKHLKMSYAHKQLEKRMYGISTLMCARHRGGVTNWPAVAAHTALLHTVHAFFSSYFSLSCPFKVCHTLFMRKQKRIKWIDKSEWHCIATCNEASLNTNWNSTCEHVCACACTSHLPTILSLSFSLHTDFCFLPIKQTAKEIKWDEKTVQYASLGRWVKLSAIKFSRTKQTLTQRSPCGCRKNYT